MYLSPTISWMSLLNCFEILKMSFIPGFWSENFFTSAVFSAVQVERFASRFLQFVPSASNNKVSERMVWNEVFVFSVVIHRSEVCVVEHSLHLVLL